VSKLTGLPTDTLRAWERRYRAVTPARDRRGRVYSDDDVQRLRLLRLAVASGHSIGRVAALGNEDLRRLTASSAAETHAALAIGPTTLDRSMLHAALLAFDTAAVDHEFWRLAAAVPPVEFVQDVLMPTLREVGENWNQAQGQIAYEHLTSAAVRHLLGSFLRMYARRDASIRLLFATPPRERHEIGILGAAMLATSQGFAVSYVGPDLPVREIVAAVRASQARVLVIGLTLAGNGHPRKRDLRAILRTLPPGVELWAGGPGTVPVADLLRERAIMLNDFEEFLLELARLGRTRP
jgi:DNA-binding transcriptional MerR regulator